MALSSVSIVVNKCGVNKHSKRMEKLEKWRSHRFHSSPLFVVVFGVIVIVSLHWPESTKWNLLSQQNNECLLTLFILIRFRLSLLFLTVYFFIFLCPLFFIVPSTFFSCVLFPPACYTNHFTSSSISICVTHFEFISKMNVDNLCNSHVLNNLVTQTVEFVLAALSGMLLTRWTMLDRFG